MKNKKVLLLWYQQEDNFGDMLLYETTKDYLERGGYSVESHEVGDSEIKILYHANLCDFMMFAGGGIIERYVPRVIQNITNLIGFLQVSYGVIGVGIGDFDYKEYAEALKCWVNYAEFFYVRDMETKNYLNELYGNEKVRFSGDVVFSNKKMVRNIQNGDGIGLNLRNIPYTDIQKDFDWILMDKVLNEVRCNILIPDCSDQTVNLHHVFNNINELKDYQTLVASAKINQTILAIQSCNIIIAMRFHVVLVAALFGVIPIPILYCPKVRYLTEQLGIMELAVNLGEWEKLPEKVELAKKERDKYLMNIGNNIALLQTNVQNMYENVLDKMEELL